MGGAGEPTIDGVEIDQLRTYLSDANVSFAVLFGSRVRETSNESSDVDVALKFDAETDPHERFRRRNRIDADLQEFASNFVDVSDIDTLPTAVAYAALRDGVVLVGNEPEIESYREKIEREYEQTSDERATERQRFIDRLARGET
ncbi:MAG: nucleotidyltransferase family protein [Halorientalis sp.]